MGIFSNIQRVGNKIANGIHSAAQVGKKITGAVSRVGHKLATHAKNAVNLVERVPVLGTALAPVTGVVRSGIGIVENVADIAGTANKLIDRGDKLVRMGQDALNTRDTAGAMRTIREARDLGKSSGKQLQRASEVLGSARSLAGQGGGAVGESKANVMKNVVQMREQARSAISSLGGP